MKHWQTDWLALNGDNNGFSSGEDDIQPRCMDWLIFVGTCIRPQALESEEDQIESRWPCPPGTAPVGIFTVEEGSDCGSANGIPFPAGSGSGGGGWTGTAPGGPGNNGSPGGGNNGCLGCNNDPWGDPIISAQMQQCDLIANIMSGQVAGSLNQFSQVELDLCVGLNAIVSTITVDGTDLSFLLNHPEILTSLQAFIESGVATTADMAAMNRFLNLWKEGKISMAWREFLALYRLVFGEIGPELGLTVLEKEWLLEQGTLARDKIKNFLDISQNNGDPNAIGFASFAISLMIEDSEIRWDRLEELYNLVNDNPNSLIEPCLNGNSMIPLSFWSDLASFTPPAVVIEKINSLPGDWEIQDIEDASGNRVNLDYFPVKVTTLPEKSPGVRYTADEFLTYIRKHINDFAVKEGTHFDPIPGDENLWLSDNPLTAVISITINPDDGSVITSQHEPCCWIFTTLKADSDWFETDDGWHPVSGNRQFGYSQNPDGSYIFYAKGADRVTKWYHNLGEDMAFDGADDLWTNFQANVRAFVNEKGGSSSLSAAAVALRPNWAEIRSRLKTSTPITSVPCN